MPLQSITAWGVARKKDFDLGGGGREGGEREPLTVFLQLQCERERGLIPSSVVPKSGCSSEGLTKV